MSLVVKPESPRFHTRELFELPLLPTPLPSPPAGEEVDFCSLGDDCESELELESSIGGDTSGVLPPPGV
jgi:hypothetical protein